MPSHAIDSTVFKRTYETRQTHKGMTKNISHDRLGRSTCTSLESLFISLKSNHSFLQVAQSATPPLRAQWSDAVLHSTLASFGANVLVLKVVLNE